ncbi:hypothetical protein ACH4PU_35145 [Streptomyces sp. NPDC021100]|uniref:hypothetical protein n=1 Tax=Streptomyces sp. NPDC021100 TaxID=3365114 RepID=UPI0037B3FC78
MITITDTECPAGHPEPAAVPTPQQQVRENVARAAHELQQILGTAGLIGPTVLVAGDRPRIRLDFIEAETADALTLLVRKSLKRAFRTADELGAAFRAHLLEMPEPRVHQAKIRLGEITLPTADRLARLLGAPPEHRERDVTEWAEAQRVLGRLGTAFTAATDGGFLDLLFQPDCLRCDGTAAVALGDINVRTARRLVSVLQFGACL